MRTEFEFIHNIKKKYDLRHIGDDCAVLPKDAETDLLITADMLVEDIDFRLDWTSPEFLAHKVLAVSLSDIAAMGGTPKWALLSLGVPEGLWNSDFPDKFFNGFSRLAKEYRVEIVGGDMSETPDKLIMDSIVGGEVPHGRAIRRSNAKPGDEIYVTGPLGGAAAGLILLEQGNRYEPSIGEWKRKLLMKQLQPLPRTSLGIALRESGVSAMIDLSDGLSSDLAHICEASGVGASISAEMIPIERKVDGLEISADEKLYMALNGGEDFELLFTVPRQKILELKDLPVTRIGVITSNPGKIEIIRGGIKTDLEPRGYRHF